MVFKHVTRIPIVVVLRITAGPETDVALLELLVANEDLRHHRRRLFTAVSPDVGTAPNFASTSSRTRSCSRLPTAEMIRLCGGVGVAEIPAQKVGVERFHRLRPAENGATERVILPEALREQLVDEVVGRVLDHLDLFEDHLLLALDIVRTERGVQHDIGQDVDGQRQVLVEHLDVVAGVFLRGEGVELPPDRIDRLRDVFGRTRRRALEQHVLDEMGDPAALGGFMPRPPGEPDADTDRTDLGHLLGEETEAVVENVSDDG